MTTYLTWLVPDGGSVDVPEKVRDLKPVNAKGPKAAAAMTAHQCTSWDVPSVDIGVLRADFLHHRTWAFIRRYTIVFTRLVKEVRRAA